MRDSWIKVDVPTQELCFLTVFPLHFFFCVCCVSLCWFSPYNSAEVAKTEATEVRAQQAEALQKKSEELASSLDQQVCNHPVELARFFGHAFLGTRGDRSTRFIGPFVGALFGWWVGSPQNRIA